MGSTPGWERVTASVLSRDTTSTTYRIVYSYPSVCDFYAPAYPQIPAAFSPPYASAAFQSQLRSSQRDQFISAQLRNPRIEQGPPPPPPHSSVPYWVIHFRLTAAYLSSLPMSVKMTVLTNEFSRAGPTNITILQDRGTSIDFEATIRPSEMSSFIELRRDIEEGFTIAENAAAFAGFIDVGFGRSGATLGVIRAARRIEPDVAVPFWTLVVSTNDTSYVEAPGKKPCAAAFAVAWALRVEWSWTRATLLYEWDPSAEYSYLVEIRPPTMDAYHALRDNMLLAPSRSVVSVVNERYMALTYYQPEGNDRIAVSAATLWDGPELPPGAVVPRWEGEFFFSGLPTTVTAGVEFRDAVAAAVVAALEVPPAWVTIDSISEASPPPRPARRAATTDTAARELQAAAASIRVKYTVQPPTYLDYTAQVARVDAAIASLQTNTTATSSGLAAFVADLLGLPPESFTAVVVPIVKASTPRAAAPAAPAKDDALPGGAIGGIVVGVIVAVGVAAAAYYFLVHAPAASAAKSGAATSAAAKDPVVMDPAMMGVEVRADTVVFRVPQQAGAANPAFGARV
jgi:hypothetical protein